MQLKDKKDQLRRCCHSYSATWPLPLGTDSQPLYSEAPRLSVVVAGVPKMSMLGIQQEVSTSELCAKRYRAMADTSAQSNLRHNAVAGTIQLAQQLAPEAAQKQLCELVASDQ